MSAQISKKQNSFLSNCRWWCLPCRAERIPARELSGKKATLVCAYRKYHSCYSLAIRRACYGAFWLVMGIRSLWIRSWCNKEREDISVSAKFRAAREMSMKFTKGSWIIRVNLLVFSLTTLSITGMFSFISESKTSLWVLQTAMTLNEYCGDLSASVSKQMFADALQEHQHWLHWQQQQAHASFCAQHLNTLNMYSNYYCK